MYPGAHAWVLVLKVQVWDYLLSMCLELKQLAGLEQVVLGQHFSRGWVAGLANWLVSGREALWPWISATRPPLSFAVLPRNLSSLSVVLPLVHLSMLQL